MDRQRVPIAELETSPDTSSLCVRGIVTLVWPYAASKQSTSVLLVEPDFRLRQNKGQVRVTFQGPCALSVAKSGLTSGDEVILALEGAHWVEDDTRQQTPGRGLDLGLLFKTRLGLEVELKTRESKPLY